MIYAKLETKPSLNILRQIFAWKEPRAVTLKALQLPTLAIAELVSAALLGATVGALCGQVEPVAFTWRAGLQQRKAVEFDWLVIFKFVFVGLLFSTHFCYHSLHVFCCHSFTTDIEHPDVFERVNQ